MLLTASGILLENKKILLLQRSNYTQNYPNFWGCPGGRGEKNETPKQIAIREVKEECGLDFSPTQLFKTTVWQNRQCFRFLGTWKGTVKIQESEVANYGWFSYKETLKLNLSFDYKAVINLLQKQHLL